MNGRKAATIMFILYLGSLAFVYADQVLQFNFTWTTEIISIGAYTNEACTIPFEPETELSLVTPGASQDFVFWIKNEGTINTNVIVDNEIIVSGTASWNPTTLTNLAPNAIASMTLTLTFGEESGGSYDFDFEAVKP